MEDKNLPKKSDVNLSEINLRNLLVEARDILTAPKPIFFKKFGNRQLEQDVKRIGLINNYISNLVQAGQSLVRLNVDAITSMEKIQLMAQTELNYYKLEAKKSSNNLVLEDSEFEYSIKALKNNIQDLTYQINSKKLLLEEQEFALKAKKEEHEMSMKEREHNLKIREMELEQRIKESDQQIRENELDAQNRLNMTEVHIYIEKLKADNESKFNKSFITLYNKMSEELKLENITPSQVLVLISLFSKNPAANYEDVDAKRALFNETLKKMKQDTAYRKAEARDKRLDNEVKVYKMRKENTDLDIDFNG